MDGRGWIRGMLQNVVESDHIECLFEYEVFQRSFQNREAVFPPGDLDAARRYFDSRDLEMPPRKNEEIDRFRFQHRVGFRFGGIAGRHRVSSARECPFPFLWRANRRTCPPWSSTCQYQQKSGALCRIRTHRICTGLCHFPCRHR